MSDERLTPLGNAGIVVIVIGCILLPLGAEGFFFPLPVPYVVTMLISVLCGAIGGGMLTAHKSLVAGVVGGLITGLLCPLALHFYLDGREEMWQFEPVIVALVAALPGIGVGFLIMFLQDMLTGGKD